MNARPDLARAAEEAVDDLYLNATKRFPNGEFLDRFLAEVAEKLEIKREYTRRPPFQRAVRLQRGSATE